MAQYDAYEPVPGYHVNGELTLGENIGDNSGLALAYKAYQLALGGKAAPVIDGFSGDQRFYLGWAQVWRGKTREDQAIEAIKVDPHAPAAVRGTAPLVNQPGFYAAFGLKPGDRMYLPPRTARHHLVTLPIKRQIFDAGGRSAANLSPSRFCKILNKKDKSP